VKQVSVVDLALDSGTGRAQWIDVRSASEYATGHLPGAVNMPMEEIEARRDDLSANVPIVLVCQSGNRARLVAGLLEPSRDDVAVLEGGTRAWIRAGLPVVVSARTRWSMERQVRLGAGLLVTSGILLARVANSYWLYLALIAGLGLLFAGLTDFCPMAVLFAKLPWNRVAQPRMAQPGEKRESCSL